MSASALRRVAGVLIIAAMGASAAYSANVADLRDRYKPPAQRLGANRPRAAAPVADVPGATTTTLDLQFRSQPWWQQVGTFDGNGAGETEPFQIARHAIQWRAKVRCDDGPVRLVAVRDGKESRRRLLDLARCGDDSPAGYAVRTGRHSIRVEAPGTWQLTVEQQVDVPLVEELPAEAASPAARVLATYRFYGVDREGRGTARAIQLPDGRRILRLEDFFVSINSDLEIRLSELPAPRSTPEAAGAPWKQIAFLKATTGAMNYELPPDVDLARFRSVVIWCEITANAYAAAARA